MKEGKLIYKFRNSLISGLLICLLISCSQSKKESDTEAVDEEVSIEENEMPGQKIPEVPLGFLVSYEGKYAAQEGVLKHELLAERLKALDRFNYDLLIQNYNTETPIVIVDDIVHMSGCKQHACPSSAYDFFIDLNNDNINIYHFRNNMLRMYQEKGMIDLPEDFSKEMEIKKSNAGIGNTESIESKYEL